MTEKTKEREVKKNILILLFDGLPAYRMKLYGGMVKTPCIEQMAREGTCYMNVISAAPSTAMAFTSIFTGLFPHEFGRRSYTNEDSGLPIGTVSLFEALESQGYTTCIQWSEDMETANPVKYRVNAWSGAKVQFRHFGRHFHNLSAIVGGQIYQCDQVLKTCDDLPEPWFLFVRFNPVVGVKFRGISDKTTKMKCDDVIYEADHLIEKVLQNRPPGTEIYLVSDHGHMHGEQGIWGYAFNLCEGTLRVPLIYSDCDSNKGERIDELISLINLKNIVLKKPLRKTKYLYADTAYADQWHRKTMVRKGHWKYVFHRDGWPVREQLFDLSGDPFEMINLAQENYSDPYRDGRPKGDTADSEYSPSGLALEGKPIWDILPRTDWKKVRAIHKELSEERKRIWALQNVFE